MCTLCLEKVGNCIEKRPLLKAQDLRKYDWRKDLGQSINLIITVEHSKVREL